VITFRASAQEKPGRRQTKNGRVERPFVENSFGEALPGELILREKVKWRRVSVTALAAMVIVAKNIRYRN
jgi:hypothetical protein